MKKIMFGLMVLLGSMAALPVFAAAHLRVVNNTYNSIDVQCGHDGQAGRAHGISPDHSQGVEIHGRGEIHCTAYNDHGNRVGSRSFHYDHGDESFTWNVGGHGGGH